MARNTSGEKRNTSLHGHRNEENIDDIYQNRIALAEPVNLSDGSLERGCILEIASDQVQMQEMTGDDEDLFCNASLFSSLTLGAGSGMLEDDDHSSDDGEPFEKLAKKMEDVSGDGGVLKTEIWPGTGTDIPKDAVITFHYSAFLEYSDEPFDSTHLRNRPERKKLDSGDLLPGLNTALKTMRVGEKSRFLFGPEYAYGKLGCPPRIPGNETLLFEIHVISFVDECSADAYDSLDYETQQSASFQQKLEGARGFHRKGNDLYRLGEMKGAKDAYLRAIWILEYAKLQNEEEEKLRGEVLIKVRCNLAQVFLDLKQPGKTCTQCNLALDVTGVKNDDIRAKLFYRRGKAKSMLCDFGRALQDLRIAQKLRPHNADIRVALESVLLKNEKYKKQEKFMCQRMFQSANKGEEKCNLTDNSQWDVSQGHLNVQAEFQNLVEDQIIDFINDSNVQELPFPPTLSQDEISYVAAAAKAADLKVTLAQRGMEYHLKIAKNS